jgi:hypothetical protein
LVHEVFLKVWRSAGTFVSARSQPKGGEGVGSDRELMLEDGRSISEGLWRMAWLAQDAAEVLGSRIEDENLDSLAEAVEVREALERLQALSIEVGEEIDAYKQRFAQYVS